MAARRDLPFPLVIICLVFIEGYTSLPTTSEVTGSNPTRLLSEDGLLTEALMLPSTDYYDDSTGPPVSPKYVIPDGGALQPCDYNSCLENQTSCAKLIAIAPCLCPGITPNDVIPEAPQLKTVSWNGSEVVVKWCAPYSYVTAYSVTVGGQKSWSFRKEQRSGAVGVIDHIAEVCVVAVNDAGNSAGSCTMYHPRDNILPLTAGLIGGALGFLLLLLLAVLLWRHKRQRKQEASISMQNVAETQ